MKAHWDDDKDEGGLRKTQEFYKKAMSSPLFHPHGKVQDGTHYQLLDSNQREKEAMIDFQIKSYEPKNYETAESSDVLADDEWLLNLANGSVATETNADYIGAKFRLNLAMLSVMSHVDTLHEDSLNDDSKGALLYLCHNSQPPVNHRDITHRYCQVHDRRYTRTQVQEFEKPVDIETTCLGWFNRNQQFSNTFVGTPMEVMKEGDASAVFESYDRWTSCDAKLSRKAYGQRLSFPCLASLYTIVVDGENALRHVCEELNDFIPVLDPSSDYDVKKAKAFIRVTHFVLNSISEKFDKFLAWKDFVKFALRLYHLSPDIRKFGDQVKEFSPKWVAIWYRMDELVYFTRIMFNNRFNFRLPMIDGATKKFAADMALMRLFPVTCAAEAAEPEKWAVEIKGIELCDEPHFISRIITYPISVLVLTSIEKENSTLENQMCLWRDVSHRKQQTDLQIAGGSFRVTASQLVNKQISDGESPLNPASWEKCDKDCWLQQKMKFKKALLTEVFKNTDTFHHNKLKKVDSLEKETSLMRTFTDKLHALHTNRMNSQDRTRSAQLLPLDYISHWIVHPAAATEEDEFSGNQAEIICTYLERNGLISPFCDAMSGTIMLYPRSNYWGNFPVSDRYDWPDHLNWSSWVQRKYVCFYIAAALQLLETYSIQKVRVGLLELAKEIHLSTALSDFMETVNEFGHEIPVPKEWVAQFPKLCKWMKPTDEWFPKNPDQEHHFHTKTNIPQALALLMMLAKMNLPASLGISPGIKFSNDFLRFYEEKDLFPPPEQNTRRDSIKRKGRGRSFNPQQFSFARVSYRLTPTPVEEGSFGKSASGGTPVGEGNKVEDEKGKRYSATRMLVHIMKEKSDSTLLKGIESAVSQLPDINYPLLFKTNATAMGKACMNENPGWAAELSELANPIECSGQNKGKKRGRPKQSHTTGGKSPVRKKRSSSKKASKKRSGQGSKNDEDEVEDEVEDDKEDDKVEDNQEEEEEEEDDKVEDNQEEEEEEEEEEDEEVEEDEEDEEVEEGTSSPSQMPKGHWTESSSPQKVDTESQTNTRTATPKATRQVSGVQDTGPRTIGFSMDQKTNDYKTLLICMDNTERAVVVQGLLQQSLKFIVKELISELTSCINKGVFRKFSYAEGQGEYVENHPDKSMTLPKFLNHLQVGTQDLPGKPVHYLVDMSLRNCLPGFHDSMFSKWFPLPGIRPGGEYCMMHHLAQDSRTDMGPNLFVGFPGAFTSLHLDGNGMVDSAHLCLQGYNEVFMLPRLYGNMLDAALKVLKATYSLDKSPHELDDAKRLNWPTKEMVKGLETHSIVPTILILAPGELLHIGKGCLHCFRKLTLDVLPDTDVHESLRKTLVKGLSNTRLDFCVSIAWDWMYTGCTEDSQQRELAHVMQKPRATKSTLALPETCLLRMAEVYSCSSNHKYQGKCTLIKAPLEELIAKHTAILNARYESQICTTEADVTMEYVVLSGRDPMGNNYLCTVCSRELSNIYHECDGCFRLLSEDYYLCDECYINNKNEHHRHNLTQSHNYSSINHYFGTSEQCTCGTNSGTMGLTNTRECVKCNQCELCVCQCHTVFTRRCRFYTKDTYDVLLRKVRARATAEETAKTAAAAAATLSAMNSRGSGRGGGGVG